MDLRPLSYTDATLAHYCALFATSFPGVAKFTPEYLRWLYLDNPEGRAAGFDAWDGERLAAHYVCVPAKVRVAGAERRLLLSLNTATHPDYQGRGLFTRLAEQTYAAGAAAGMHGCYGVANANSTPGFLRKLGFQLVRPLEARIGLGTLPRVPPGSATAFERVWDDASLAWRCANPHGPVRARRSGTRSQFTTPARGALLAAYAELDGGLALPAAQAAGAGPLRLFLGLLPDAAGPYRAYASIPRRLRPSPLNLIYRPFGAPETLDSRAVRFSFLDFDAY